MIFNGSNCNRKSQLSGILTVRLNPRVLSCLFRRRDVVCSLILCTPLYCYLHALNCTVINLNTIVL